MKRSALLLPFLAACAAGPGPSAAPVSAALDAAGTLRLIRADGTACEVAPPPGTAPGESWSAEAPGCPGITTVEVIVAAPGEPAILRMADAGGPLDGGSPGVTVWAGLGDGIWAEYAAPGD